MFGFFLTANILQLTRLKYWKRELSISKGATLDCEMRGLGGISVETSLLSGNLTFLLGQDVRRRCHLHVERDCKVWREDRRGRSLHVKVLNTHHISIETWKTNRYALYIHSLHSSRTRTAYYNISPSLIFCLADLGLSRDRQKSPFFLSRPTLGRFTFFFLRDLKIHVTRSYVLPGAFLVKMHRVSLSLLITRKTLTEKGTRNVFVLKY